MRPVSNADPGHVYRCQWCGKRWRSWTEVQMGDRILVPQCGGCGGPVFRDDPSPDRSEP